MSALEDLPLELIDRILAHLDDPNDVARLLVVSRTFLARAIASSGQQRPLELLPELLSALLHVNVDLDDGTSPLATPQRPHAGELTRDLKSSLAWSGRSSGHGPNACICVSDMTGIVAAPPPADNGLLRLVTSAHLLFLDSGPRLARLFPHLRRLSVGRIVRPPELSCLAALPHLRELTIGMSEALEFWDPLEVTKQVAAAFSDFPRMLPCLESLRLYVSGAALARSALMFVPFMRSLRSLHLRLAEEFQPSFAVLVSVLSRASTLTDLNLETDFAIGRETLGPIRELRHLTRLRVESQGLYRSQGAGPSHASPAPVEADGAEAGPARDLDVSQLESLQSLSLLLSGPRQVGPVPDSGDLGKDLLRQLERLTQLTALFLSPLPADLAPGVSLPLLPRLRIVHLQLHPGSRSLSPALLESLLPSRCPDLRCLSISGQSPHAPIQVYDEALTAVARLTQLCSLRMVPVTMSRGSLWRLRDMPALRTLHLETAGMKAAEDWDSLGSLTQLRRVALDFTCVPQGTATAPPGHLLRLTALTNLRRLSVGGPGVADNDIAQCVSRMPSLRRLELLDTLATEATLVALCQHEGLRQVLVRPGPPLQQHSVEMARHLARCARGGQLTIDICGPDYAPELWAGMPLSRLLRHSGGSVAGSGMT